MPHGQIVIEIGWLNSSCQPGSASILAQWLPCFENRPSPSIKLADLHPVERRMPQGSKAGGGAHRPGLAISDLIAGGA